MISTEDDDTRLIMRVRTDLRAVVPSHDDQRARPMIDAAMAASVDAERPRRVMPPLAAAAAVLAVAGVAVSTGHEPATRPELRSHAADATLTPVVVGVAPRESTDPGAEPIVFGPTGTPGPGVTTQYSIVIQLGSNDLEGDTLPREAPPAGLDLVLDSIRASSTATAHVALNPAPTDHGAFSFTVPHGKVVEISDDAVRDLSGYDEVTCEDMFPCYVKLEFFGHYERTG